jgi:photosystem II stability/assembly factor-like uncharacterized protein
MKTSIHKIMPLIFILAFSMQTVGQQHFTPYDDLPGIQKSYKPTYEDNFPDWAKMLYVYPLNFNELTAAFQKYSSNNPNEKSAIIRYFKIWSRVVEAYVNESGEIVIPNEIPVFYENKSSENKNVDSKSSWTFLGPKETFWLNESGSDTPPSACPWQVNVYSFDVAFSNENILFAGTETGFVNKTTDKGLNWSLVGSNHVFGGSVTATVIHPQNPDIVYVAAGNQIHKTSDGGQTWTAMLTSGNTFSADRLRIDPADPDKIIAATATGVFISTDGGENWINRWNKSTYDIEIQPGNSNTIFTLSAVAGKFSVAASNNGGITFNAQSTFPANITDVSGGLLATTPDDPSLLLAVMLSSNDTPLLYKGITTGMNTTWTLLATGQTGSFPMDNGQGYFDLVLEISPVSKDIIFAGTTTLFKSSNAGQNFHAIGGYSGNFAIHPDIQDMKLLENGETWVSTDGGMTLTTDNFTSTSNYVAYNNGLVGSDMWGFDQGWNEDIVVGGRYHNGNTSIADFYQPKALRMGGAESPTGWVLQGKSRHVAFNDLGNGWILPATAEGIPEGRFIFSKYPNMEEYGGRRSNMVFHPNYYGTIYLGEERGVWKSLDMGISYTLLHNFTNTVRYLQISNKNSMVVYVDVNGMGLYRSGDGGITWSLKPALTNGEYGSAYWKGKLFFAISPYNENVIYACLQNGTWTADIGKVFRSEDGGDTWTDFTGSLSEYTKCLVIQPGSEGQDIVYLFSNSRNGQAANVFYRTVTMDDWEPFNMNYPVGMTVNMALPFFRDGKLRVAGNAGVWESPLLETVFEPLVDPWVEKPFYNCMTDTLYFDDHSIVNHAEASWHWNISPEPTYISDANSRNPKVVLGNTGTYSVDIQLIQSGITYEKTLSDMVNTTTCPSIEDCENPAEIPKNIWNLVYVDSEEVNYPGTAVMAFDDDPSSIWHTRWSTGDDPYPHEIQINMGQPYKLFDFTILNRQDGENGRIKEYALYISENSQEWGEAVSTGQFVNTAAPQTINFDEPLIGRYFRLVALSEVNGNPWASAAEFYLKGCTDITSVEKPSALLQKIETFPVPVKNQLTICLPNSKFVSYKLYNTNGSIVSKGDNELNYGQFRLDLTGFADGIYVVDCVNESGMSFHVKVIKE